MWYNHAKNKIISKKSLIYLLVIKFVEGIKSEEGYRQIYRE